MNKFIFYLSLSIAALLFLGYKASWHIKYKTECVEYHTETVPHYKRHGNQTRFVGYVEEQVCDKQEIVKRN